MNKKTDITSHDQCVPSGSEALCRWWVSAVWDAYLHEQHHVSCSLIFFGLFYTLLLFGDKHLIGTPHLQFLFNIFEFCWINKPTKPREYAKDFLSHHRGKLESVIIAGGIQDQLYAFFHSGSWHHLKLSCQKGVGDGMGWEGRGGNDSLSWLRGSFQSIIFHFHTHQHAHQQVEQLRWFTSG